MQSGAITNYIDTAQLALYAFWIFFAGLIYYLRREDKREGFPMITESGARPRGFPEIPKPKRFLLPHGGVAYAPREETVAPLLHARATAGFAGAPLEPIGNPLLSGIGPSAYADRSDVPDLTLEGVDKLVPLRVARECVVSDEDPDPRGMEVVGTDGLTAGIVHDLWLDRSDQVFRYLEIRLTGTLASVLVPLNFAQFLPRGRIRVRALRADQFADVPPLATPDRMTPREEDRIVGYYGGGQLYALPERLGPVL